MLVAIALFLVTSIITPFLILGWVAMGFGLWSGIEIVQELHRRNVAADAAEEAASQP